ncbi:MAG: cardiolipin synthase [Syntrophomonadaceae bacterium]|nr:cardiolipin synthase [Syntrophomonadaceae bacterium]
MTLIYSGSQYINYLFILNIILALMVVGFERRKPTATLSWLLLMLFLPGFGFLLYMFLGQDLRKKRLFYIKEGEEREIFTLVQQQEENFHNNELVFNNPRVQEYKDIIHLHLNNQALYTQDNWVRIYQDGADLFRDLAAAIEQAKQYIHLEYYIIRNDNLGRSIMDLLVRKARQGIEVKLLYDGMGCMRLPRQFFRPLIEAGGQTANFFPPLLPYINLRINYRNHRKICLIDGEDGFTGGFNIGDEYLGISELGYWRDTHIRIKGSALDDLEMRFLLDWRYASCDNFIADSHYFPKRVPQGDTGIQIVSSGPDSKWSAIKNGYLKMISSARRNIYLQTPYFVPDDSILEGLRIAALSGIEVCLIIPGKPDHFFVHWASLSYVGELLEAGVRCFTYNRGFIHSKLIVVDGRVSTVGTANLDIRSFELNFEVNAFIYDEKLSREFEAAFVKDLKDCTEITMAGYLSRSVSVRVKEAFCRLLSPLL